MLTIKPYPDEGQVLNSIFGARARIDKAVWRGKRLEAMTEDELREALAVAVRLLEDVRQENARMVAVWHGANA